MAANRPRSANERVRTYRERMRQKGYRQVQLWIPDVTAPGVDAELRRQARAIRDSEGEDDNIRFVESVSIFLE